MKQATIDTVSVDMACGSGNTFRATGSTVVDKGFMAVYQESEDDKQKENGDSKLPPLKEGQHIPLKEICADQHFTEPPPRYTEASLVKSLEEYGIGRPSTYASIIQTLRQREYVEEAVRAHGRRQDREQISDGTFHRLRRLRLYRQAGGRIGRGVAWGKGLDSADA
jgi:DNA topoisomerase IA